MAAAQPHLASPTAAAQLAQLSRRCRLAPYEHDARVREHRPPAPCSSPFSPPINPTGRPSPNPSSLLPSSSHLVPPLPLPLVFPHRESSREPPPDFHRHRRNGRVGGHQSASSSSSTSTTVTPQKSVPNFSGVFSHLKNFFYFQNVFFEPDGL